MTRIDSFPEYVSYISPSGVEMKLSGHQRYSRVISGLGFAPSSDIFSRSPLQDGESYHSSRANSREIQIQFREQVQTRWDYWPRRSEILSFFYPRDGAIGILRFYFPNGKQREVDALTLGAIDFEDVEDTWDETEIHLVLRFKIPYPFFRNPVQKSVSLTVASLTGLRFPFTPPLLVDDDVMNITQECVTEGTEKTFPTIVLTGPMSGAELTNEENNAKIRINYTVSNGEAVTITLQPGSKKAISNLVGDITGILFNSDVTMFKLLPDPLVSGGSNTIRFKATGVVPGGGDTQIDITWYDMDIGI